MSQSGEGKERVAAAGPVRGGRACPVCGRPQEHRFRPFCSRRCADLDLGRWLNERYRVPAVDPAPGTAEPSSSEPT